MISCRQPTRGDKELKAPRRQQNLSQNISEPSIVDRLFGITEQGNGTWRFGGEAIKIISRV
jgi:hypothetical protein